MQHLLFLFPLPFVISCWFYSLSCNKMLWIHRCFFFNNFAFVLICVTFRKKYVLILHQHWFNWLVNILIHILFTFKFSSTGVLSIDLYSFFCVTFCVFVTMSFIDEPTLKKHCFNDILNLFIETSINFILGLSSLVVIN